MRADILVFWVDDLCVVLAEQLLLYIAEHLAEGAVDSEAASVEPYERHAYRSVHEGRAEPLLALSEPLFVR